MLNKTTSYKDIAKTSVLFGGSQIVIVITKIIKTKFVAYFLGTQGYGIFSLYTAAVNLIGTFSNLGLNTSATKSIAENYKNNENEDVIRTLTIVRKIVWITGLAGGFICLLMSSFLSEMIFNNSDFTYAIMWLSIAVVLNQLTQGNTILLRGLRKHKSLANSNATGAIIGMIISVSLYAIWGINAIVPAIICSSLAAYLRSAYFANKIEVDWINIGLRDAFHASKPMLAMGIVLSITSVLTLSKVFFLRIYVESVGGIEEVGLYHSSFIIVNSYLGIIFTIMSTDYLPDLSTKIHDKKLYTDLFNKQLIFGMMLIIPLVCAFLLFNKWIIILLFNSKFKGAELLIAWSVLGMFFKLISWTQSFIILSKGDNKRFALHEITSIIVTTIITILLYNKYGLHGMGIGFTIGYFYYSLQTYFLCRHWYKIDFNKQSKITIFLGALILSSAFFTIVVIKNLGLGIIVTLVSSVFSFWQMKKMGFTSKIKSLLMRKTKKA